jgi:hypothetical protein
MKLKYRDILKLKILCAADSTCPQLTNVNKEKSQKLKIPNFAEIPDPFSY